MTDATGEALRLLIAERDRIDQAISLLQGGAAQEAPRRRGRPPGSKNVAKAGDGSAAKPAKKKRGRREMTAAEKEKVSNRMKAYWAARRKAAKKAKKQ